MYDSYIILLSYAVLTVRVCMQHVYMVRGMAISVCMYVCMYV